MRRKKVWGLVATVFFVSVILFSGEPQVLAEGSPTITFSNESGDYSSSFSLTMTTEVGCSIYYTTNGDVPTISSTKYSVPIVVKNRQGETNQIATQAHLSNVVDSDGGGIADVPGNDIAKCTVIRAMAIKDAEPTAKSSVITKSYFVGNNTPTKYNNVAVLSLVTDNANLFDYTTGIYCKGKVYDTNSAKNAEFVRAKQFWSLIGNYTEDGKEWERPAHIDFFDGDGKLAVATELGIRIHGGASRMYAQKSFNFYMKDKYGDSTLNYSLFKGETNFDGTVPVNQFSKFMIRNGGNDTEYTKLGDVIVQKLVKNRNFATQAYRPCVVFLNGEYWGLYNIQEKYGSEYVETEFGVKEDNVITVKNGQLDEGVAEDVVYYKQLQDLADLDMTKAENYKKFCDAVDLQSYMDYYATEIYIGNRDWPGNNTELWRSRSVDGKKYQDGKWRWMLFDTEFSMELYGQTTGNTVEWAMEGDPLFEAVSKNEQFRQGFITTIADIANVNFQATEANRVINNLVAIHKPLMTDFYARYKYNSYSFDSNISRMISFISSRYTSIASYLNSSLAAGTRATITFSSANADSMEVNTSTVPFTNHVFKGKYFSKYPLKVTATKVAGKVFKEWVVAGGTAASKTSAQTSITIDQSPVTVEAVYTEAPTPTPTPVVTPKPTVQPQPTTIPTVKPTAKPTVAPIKVAKVVIASVVSEKKKVLTVKLKKIEGVAGYQVVYSKSKTFANGVKSSYTSKTSLVISKLISKTRYYVKVRAYKLDGSGKKIFGVYSTVKSSKIK